MFWLSTQCAAAVCDNWTKELFKFLLCAWNWKGYIWVSVFFWQLVSLRICFLIWQDMKKYSIQGCAKGSKCVNSTNCWLLFTLCFQRRLFYKLQCWFRLMQGSYFEHTHTQTHAHIHTHMHICTHAGHNRAPSDAWFACLWCTRTKIHPLQVCPMHGTGPLNGLVRGAFTF